VVTDTLLMWVVVMVQVFPGDESGGF
jgi:hypothetical protein